LVQTVRYWLGEKLRLSELFALGSIIALIALIEAHKDIVMSERAWVGPHGAELKNRSPKTSASLLR